jgi:hypothetical protein
MNKPGTNRIVFAVLLLPALFLIYVAYILLGPINPLTINKVTVETPTVDTKGVLMYRFDYCKHVKEDATVFRQFVPSNGGDPITFPSVLSIARNGCASTVVPLAVLPGTKPGKYRLKGHLIYQINGLRTVSVDYLTAEFTITAQ